MKYDFSKCNNLRWEYEGRKGFCRVYKDYDKKERIAFVLDGKDYDGEHYIYIQQPVLILSMKTVSRPQKSGFFLVTLALIQTGR